MKKLLAASLLLVSTAAFAQDGEPEKKAGLFVEPGITYQMNDTEVNWTSVFDNSTGKNNGLGLMARLGFHVSEAFFAGVDARYSMTKFEDSAFDKKVNAKSWNAAPVVGIQMPDYGIRLWGSYVLAGEIDPDKIDSNTGDYDAKATEGKGYRVGVGFHVQSLSLNLEYQDLKYDKATVAHSLGTAELNEVKEKGFVASVSFPIEL